MVGKEDVELDNGTNALQESAGQNGSLTQKGNFERRPHLPGQMSRFGRIYFISNGDAIKIGFAKDVTARLQDLQVGHHVPLLLIGSIAGRQSTEREFHERLKHIRLSGEWFEIHADVFKLIQELEVKRGWIEGEDEDDYAIKVHNALGLRDAVDGT